MKVRAQLIVLCTCAFLLIARSQESISAQKTSSPLSPPISSHVQLRNSSKVAFTGFLPSKARCDDSGNLYLRLVLSQTPDPSKSPIHKIRSNGTLSTVYKVPGTKTDVSAMDFFVSPAGNVYEQEYTRDGTVFVAEFSVDGTLRSRIQLDAEPFVPYEIVAFPSGALLLSGTLANPGGRHHTPFTALFDASGKLIRKIYEPEDEDYRKKAESRDPDFIRYAGTSNAAIYEGDAALGSDGNAYLLRATSPALVYVISHNGDVIRKLQIASPEPGLTAQRLRPAKNRLAISFLQKQFDRWYNYCCGSAWKYDRQLCRRRRKSVSRSSGLLYIHRFRFCG